MAKKSKYDIWLTDGEDLLCAAEAAGGKKPKTLLLTNKRLVLIEETKTKEWSDIDDKMWKQFSAIKLAQGFWHSTLTVSFSGHFESEDWTFEKVKKDAAAQAYRMMKNREVALREAGKAAAAAPPAAKPVAEKKTQDPAVVPAPVEKAPAAADKASEPTAEADSATQDEAPKKRGIIEKLFHKK
ncbi:MAG: PH domain-containing protein [Mariprofundaceae bacterium]|nr:PH domain-containing protein [Mariprofundaceae bacterium]